jgi:hypothetical protein
MSLNTFVFGEKKIPSGAAEIFDHPYDDVTTTQFLSYQARYSHAAKPSGHSTT